ncbi:MAG: hypothetical protein JNJ47_07960 [Alphaproteobacteria bacterium]|nr:hypothetical protein [Alphaproteobacteria bacterium]
MNTHNLIRKWIYKTLLKKIVSSPYGLLRMAVKEKSITLLCILPLCNLLTGCGLKSSPHPPEDAIITYPRPYPNPKLEEWSIAEECPPVEVCSPAKVCGE